MEFLKKPENEPKNLIVLDKIAHEEWTRVNFALRPDHHSSTPLVLEFVHLASTSAQGAFTYQKDDYTDSLIRQTRDANNNRVYHPPETGDKIILEVVKDTEACLPSWQLLELQWYLHRIARVCAAGEVLKAAFEKTVPRIPRPF
ncbi:hypothetical protein F5Y17DRAFT_205510 [Xylariaceae sp. FL0594]|nr:hypothetical protein F5Y17DRAFT_205510 [Xylariaceae sp. FL0594]